MGYGYKGQKDYERFLKGEKLTRKQAILANCYECTGFYDSGKRKCLVEGCPLRQYYPYGIEKPTPLEIKNKKE